MKKQLQFFFLLATLTGFMVVACAPDEGDTSTDPRDAYVGEWQFTESFKNTEGQNYLVTITKDPNFSSQIILANFGNPGSNNVTAIGIVTSTKVTIVSQQLSNSNWTVDGSGSFSDSNKTTMNWNYSITAGGSKDTYIATATKQ